MNWIAIFLRPAKYFQNSEAYFCEAYDDNVDSELDRVNRKISRRVIVIREKLTRLLSFSYFEALQSLTRRSFINW